jgi:hypothetical protein
MKIFFALAGKALFPLSQIVSTPGAIDACSNERGEPCGPHRPITLTVIGVPACTVQES